MNEFTGRTVFPTRSYPHRIHYRHPVYTAGSCFATELEKRFLRYQFDHVGHPFGICFNPLSLADQLQMLANGHLFGISDLVCQDGLFHSLDHHGYYSGEDPERVLGGMQSALDAARMRLPQLEYMVLTLGSAHYYFHTGRGRVVANCHKIPQREFEKRRAGLEEICEQLGGSMDALLRCAPKLRFLLTVSPVRYLADGFVENSRSKATLLLACERLCRRFEQADYFPAYEMFMDDLRDYRYAAEDMLHPSPQAIAYIWSHFERGYLHPEAADLAKRMEAFQRMLEHRMLHQSPARMGDWRDRLLENLDVLRRDFPEVDFTATLNRLDSNFPPGPG
jgi:hypothetical protein